MDLVKTLLVYMTVLLTSSTALSPALTPMPALTATPVVITAAPLVTPAPATFVPPSATPRLTTLYVGDRGENVRIMQTRLKELGYLAGTVDGIFGKETLRAVERFQSYNNLSVDGIAGTRTLNKLYYDPNVVYGPVDVTPPPTIRPMVTASLPVYYLSTDGVRLYTDVVLLSEGRTTLRANSDRVPRDYTLVSASQVTVTVNARGEAAPASVTFTYQRQQTPPATAQVAVNYVDQNNALLNRETLTLAQGTTSVYANDRMVPQGYALTGSRIINVTVSANGIANPSAVSFVYARVNVTAAVSVNYVDTRGGTLYQDRLILPAGTHTVIANMGYVPEGYTLQGTGRTTVTVSQNGAATPTSVTFTFQAPPAQAYVPVNYQDTNGRTLFEETVLLTQGVNIVTANTSLVPAGYVLQGEASVSVTVDAAGNARPATVTFFFTAPQAPSKPPTAAPTKPPTPGPVTEAPVTQAPVTPPPKVTPVPVTEAPVTQVPITPPPKITPEPVTEAPITQVPATPPPKITPEPTPEPTPIPTEAATQAPDAPALPNYQIIRFADGAYPVYTGPGEQYYQAGDAQVSGGTDCRLYGSENGFLLIGYGTADGGYRIGYITAKALPEGAATSALELSAIPRVLTAAAPLTDDPVINALPLGELPAGSAVTALASLNENGQWAYVEVADFMGSPARGFIPLGSLQ